MKSCYTISFHQSVCHSSSKLADAIHPDVNNALIKHFHKKIIHKLNDNFSFALWGVEQD